jgi:large subunit ribosomal protein L18
MALSKRERRIRIKRRIRKIVSGTNEVPRLSVYRSNKDVYVQVIDDLEGKTLLSASSQKIDKKGLTKTDLSKKIGEEIAKAAIEKGINTVVFDRNGYLYHGRIKAVAEAAREAGLKF